jgi:MoaA/NifB/PqqE/SkfB family radical SAM enzyme
MPKRLSATCILTYQCNYSCPYCDQAIDRIYTEYPHVDGSLWLKLFQQMPPSLLHLTGGEPFVYPDFYYILSNLPKKHLFFLATNLSLPLSRFIDVVDPKQIYLVSASLHPSARNFSFRQYLEQITTLQQHGIPVYVNYVAYPEQLDLIPKLKKAIEGCGAIFNVDPFISKTYHYTDEEEKKVEPYVTQKRKMTFAWEEEGKLKYCSAGQDYFYASPTGEVFRCLSGFYYHDSRSFFLFDMKDNVKLSNCSQPCSCACVATCDQNMVTIADEEGKIISKPLYSSETLLQISRVMLKHRSMRKLWNVFSPRVKPALLVRQ